MLNIKETKERLGEPEISEREAQDIRDFLFSLAEIMLDDMHNQAPFKPDKED